MRLMGLTLLLALPFFQGCETSVKPDGSHVKAAKIVNGSVIAEENPVAKFTVLIQNKRNSYCSGSLIARDVVLTAAHCFKEDKPEDLTISFGTKISNYYSGITRMSAKEIIKHENWNEETDHDDVAIVILSEEADSQFSTIALFDGPLAPDYEVFPLEAYGYSLYTLSQNIDMTDYFKEIWKESFRSREGTYGTYRLNGKLLSANENNYSTPVKNLIFVDQLSGGICSGDSGGPMVVTIDGEKVQVGINDSIINLKVGSKIDCSSHSISTYVNPYVKWINDNLESRNMQKVVTKKFENDGDIAKAENTDTSCAYTQRNVSNFMEESRENIVKNICDEALIKNIKEYVVYARDYCTNPLAAGFNKSLDVTLKSLEANCIVKPEEVK